MEGAGERQGGKRDRDRGKRKGEGRCRSCLFKIFKTRTGKESKRKRGGERSACLGRKLGEEWAGLVS